MSDTTSRLSRRNLLKALVSLPVVGAFVVGVLRKRPVDDAKKRALLAELGVSEGAPAAPAVIPTFQPSTIYLIFSENRLE